MFKWWLSLFLETGDPTSHPPRQPQELQLEAGKQAPPWKMYLCGRSNSQVNLTTIVWRIWFIQFVSVPCRNQILFIQLHISTALLCSKRNSAELPLIGRNLYMQYRTMYAWQVPVTCMSPGLNSYSASDLVMPSKYTTGNVQFLHKTATLIETGNLGLQSPSLPPCKTIMATRGWWP